MLLLICFYRYATAEGGLKHAAAFGLTHNNQSCYWPVVMSGMPLECLSIQLSKQTSQAKVALREAVGHSDHLLQPSQRRTERGFTCTYMAYILLSEFLHHVRMSNVWSSVWKCRTKRERNRLAWRNMSLKAVGKKDWYIYQTRGEELQAHFWS